MAATKWYSPRSRDTNTNSEVGLVLAALNPILFMTPKKGTRSSTNLGASWSQWFEIQWKLRILTHTMCATVSTWGKDHPKGGICSIHWFLIFSRWFHVLVLHPFSVVSDTSHMVEKIPEYPHVSEVPLHILLKSSEIRINPLNFLVNPPESISTPKGP